MNWLNGHGVLMGDRTIPEALEYMTKKLVALRAELDESYRECGRSRMTITRLELELADALHTHDPEGTPMDAKHCDDYIDDPAAPEVLRNFLDFARSPAHGMFRNERPKLFATVDGVRYRVVMASRLGDVGLSIEFDKDYGYIKRVSVDRLTEMSSEP